MGHSQRSAPQKKQGTLDRCTQKRRLGRGGEKSCCTSGEYAHQAPGSLSCSDQGMHKTQPQLSLHLCEVSKTWTWVAWAWEVRTTQGPLPVQHPVAWVVWKGRAHTPWVGATPVWPEHCEHSPNTPVIFVCSAPPSPQHDWISKPKQETTSAYLCQGEN